MNKPENESYDQCLEIFKESLIGGSEYKIIVDAIMSQTPTNRIRWLDIGVGNGKYTKKIIEGLTNEGFLIELTGIEPDALSYQNAKKILKNANILNQKFEDFKFDKKYDVINICQSFYYLKNKRKALKTIISNLSEGGLIISTLWSKKDVIYKIHKSLFKGKSFIAEDYFRLIKAFKGLQNNKLIYFRGKVNLQKWIELGENINYVFKIISRYPNEQAVTTLQTNEAINEILKFPKISLRENGVIISKKKYSIASFSDKHLQKLMENKFPSFKNIICRFKGDKEAKFMCSWEKEGRYLSHKLMGNVLELCCGIGGRTAIISEKHDLIAVDINPKRINDAIFNASLFKRKNVNFIVGDALDRNLLKSIKNIDSIIIDADWRENMEQPLKSHSLNPLRTTPSVDKLYKILRVIFPKQQIIFKISPFSKVTMMQSIGKCCIEEMSIDGNFSAYNVYFSPKITRNQTRRVFL
ncbi:MAG: methyltransferase domain-containing protein [Nanoarchaeota archaeon]|nr:methyltransferase domain-containing protein [Nanoarchaeota archaeon]